MSDPLSVLAGPVSGAPKLQATPRAARARLSAPIRAGSSGGITTDLPRVSGPIVTSFPLAIRRLASSTSQAAATNRLAESQLTRATGATRTTPSRRSSSRSSSGSSSAVTVHHPEGAAIGGTTAEPDAAASTWRAGRSPRRAVTGTGAPESPVSEMVIRPPSVDHGCGPVSIRAIPTFRAGLSSVRPTTSGTGTVAGDTAVACRSLRSTISPRRGSAARTSTPAPRAVPRSRR